MRKHVLRGVLLAAGVVVLTAVAFLVWAARGGSIKAEAEKIVLDSLETPATAHIIEATPLSDPAGEAAGYYFVHVVLDAQNRFGALTRQSYCVVYWSEGDKYKWNARRAVQECSNPPTKSDINMMKILNRWPGTEAPRR